MITTKIPETETALRLIADLEFFSNPVQYNDELSFEELDWINAAGTGHISLECLLASHGRVIPCKNKFKKL